PVGPALVCAAGGRGRGGGAAGWGGGSGFGVFPPPRHEAPLGGGPTQQVLAVALHPLRGPLRDALLLARGYAQVVELRPTRPDLPDELPVPLAQPQPAQRVGRQEDPRLLTPPQHPPAP